MRTPPPRFITGSITRHILVMASTGAVGLMAIFLGDLANIVFLSMLGDVEVVAAAGYASTILFFGTSIGIGLAIAAAALVSPALGASRRMRARRLAVNAHMFAALAAAAAALLIWLLIPVLLDWLGAAGRTHALATGYLRILVPTLPALAVAMTSSAVLRSVGDPQRAMHVTLAGAVANIVLDPILILWLGLGIDGAAIATALARIAIVSIGLYGVVRVHDLMGRPRLTLLLADAPAIARIGFPAVLTNLATPAGNAYVTAAIAAFGDGAVAGWAITGRILPVAFGAIYALSGSIGPIIGQNLGAGAYDRVRHTLTNALIITGWFTAAAWIVLAALAGPLVHAFQATGETAELIVLFCRWLAPLFMFLGALFISNAAFNTLGRPNTSTLLNWARATLGTVPFVEVGGRLWGASGAMTGNMLGGVAFGLAGVWMCYRLIERLDQRARSGT